MASDNYYIDLMNSRYSCRKFGSEQLTDDELNTILEAARISPTAKNFQPVRLCVIQSEEGLAKIDECTKCRYGAPTAIIVAYDEDVAAQLTDEFGPDTCTFGDIDASIAITNMENAATALGLGTCWIGAFLKDVVREKFNVPDNCRLVELFMVGHKEAEPSPRHSDRQPLDAMVVRESF